MPRQDSQVAAGVAAWRQSCWARGVVLLGLIMPGASTQAQQMDDEILTRLARGQTWTTPGRLGDAGLLALTFVDVTRNRFAVVVEGRRQTDQLPARILSFYVRKGRRFVETYRFTTPNAFAAMHPTVDGSRLITTWAAGSAYRTVIFALDKEVVRGVLWLGWQWPLEFVDLDGDGEEEVIHAVDGYAGATPEKADVYKWTGTTYQLLRTVPWSARYERK